MFRHAQKKSEHFKQAGISIHLIEGQGGALLIACACNKLSLVFQARFIGG
jgi:hypothetical protein